jgi:uncharacterized membrane protein YfcA
LLGGILCALGMLVGAFLGSMIAIPMSSRILEGLFGCFLMLTAVLLWQKARPANNAAGQKEEAARG